MKKKRSKWIPILTVAIVAVVAFGAYRMFAVQPAAAEANDLTATVEKGSITTTVVGTGTLEFEEGTDIDVPAGLKVKTIEVKEGDSVSTGDTLATFDETSVANAITSTQDSITDIDKQINITKDDTEPEKIKTYVSGRIKKTYADEDVEVSKTMDEHDALIILSIDGKMAVTFTTDSNLAIDDEVYVYLSDDTRKTGTVRQIADGQCTVTITDDGPELGEDVTITEKDGNTIGRGTLEINQPVVISGVNGTVKTIHYKENSKVSSGTTLITLKDLPASSENRDLLAQRADLDENLRTLVSISATNSLAAEYDGTVQSINIAENTTTGDSTSAATAGTASSSSTNTGSTSNAASADTSASSATQTSASSNSNSVVAMTVSSRESMLLNAEIDELDILSVQLGQKANVVLDAVPDQTFEGEITHISESGTAMGGVTKYSVEITMPRDDAMRGGMNATATIVIEEISDILLLPINAVQEDGREIYVYTEANDDGLGGKTAIETGVSDDIFVEIKSGLDEGDTVYFPMKQSETMMDMMMNFGGGNGGGNRPNYNGGGMGGADQ